MIKSHRKGDFLRRESEGSSRRKPADMPIRSVDPNSNQTLNTAESTVQTNAVAVPSIPLRSGLAALNRKQMEEERLARAKQKRKRSIEPDNVPSEARKQKLNANSTSSGLLQHEIGGQSQYKKPQVTPIQYPGGVLKKTWAHGFARTSDDIKIEEVLQSGSLELAVLSAFQIDADVCIVHVQIIFFSFLWHRTLDSNCLKTSAKICQVD